MATDPAYMTQGNLPKQILRFSAPLMLSNVLQVLFNMSDIAVVGQFAGAGMEFPVRDISRSGIDDFVAFRTELLIDLPEPGRVECPVGKVFHRH